MSNTQTIKIGDKDQRFHPIFEASKHFQNDIKLLPYTLTVLFENLLRHRHTPFVEDKDLKAFDSWLDQRASREEIAFHPARVLMQDFTGVPAIVDLAAMRTAMHKQNNDPKLINPNIPVDLVIDHSVQVDKFGSPDALAYNTEIEMQRNLERYQLLKWGQQSFENFRVVPPGTGICHQVNIEYLAKVVMENHDMLYPDTCVGTDSHTTMVNALGVLGWGVGGIEAEAAMLGQPISMLIPQVVGFELKGQLQEGITATDLVLTITKMLRQQGVVGKFVEFFGDGLANLSLADRATISNMSPEFGATCAFFPIDDITLHYLALTGRDKAHINVVKDYAKIQGLWHNPSQKKYYSDTLSLDLSVIQAAIAGPKRPQDKVSLDEAPTVFAEAFQCKAPTPKNDSKLKDGDIVIAAITSCTNTSNPTVLVAAGLLAKAAIEKGMTKKPWVKTSLAPGSKVVTEYLQQSGLQNYLDELGFQTVGYGCTTCIGNSGPLDQAISDEIKQNNISACAVLSGNRNFEGRIHPEVKANWLASPPLVVAYALAGSLFDIHQDALGQDKDGNPVYLKDLWPSSKAIQAITQKIDQSMFTKSYADVFEGTADWKKLNTTSSDIYDWDKDSTYIQYPPFFHLKDISHQNIRDARIIALLGDSITTDHISPAGNIQKESPAGSYLIDHKVKPLAFNSYGSRRGNHEVMMRGTFANIRIRNEMTPEKEGGYTRLYPENKIMPIYDAAMRYQENETPLVVIAGLDYGTGSSRDWAAKGTRLLGIHAVIAESFERIHRSNLIGMGVLPIEFKNGDNRKTLKLSGEETISISDLDKMNVPKASLTLEITYTDGSKKQVEVLARLDTQNELAYYRSGGILNYVLEEMR